ncbi:MAG: LTA synthase family protein [Agriterribacter sp.]
MNTNSLNPFLLKYKPIWLLLRVALVLFLFTRLFLAIYVAVTSGIPFPLAIESFFVGLMYDLLVSLFITLPFALQITFTNNFIYTAKGKWITLALFALIFILLFFTSVFPKDFNKDLYKFFVLYIVLRLAIFVFLLTRSVSFRQKWRAAVLNIFFFITVFLLVFNAVSEWFFWNEFSSRYNFIAVDYLIYSNEVVGNIKESYPITAIIIGVALITGLIVYFLSGKIRQSVFSLLVFTKRIVFFFLLAVVTCILTVAIQPGWKDFSKNNFANELSGNGIYQFVQAFKNNDLDFYKYYQTISDSAAFTLVRNNLQDSNSRFVSNDIFNIERQISYTESEKKMNVVLISVESLSASFMKAFGSTNNITPYLDALAQKGMLFTNLYASGTRTVRGLEALSLSIPPPPGQSIVKRPDNDSLFSLGSVFKSKGYVTQYIYGGYSYFDNMNEFFSNNDYEVIDRTGLQPAEIHYANIWGVADEDLFTLALRQMDKNYNNGKPFFSHVMTVSNHRPFTYPENRIDIPPSSQKREGAVKYTDYSIGKFIEQAEKKPWFNNTIFVIVADHCASSAGKQALPVTGYHIPMIIYSPSHIQPQEIKWRTAQIDIAPTILGLLHFSYKSKFFGQDIFNTPPEKQRAFISTYQGLGFLKNDTLIVQSPVKKVKTYKPDFITGDAKEIKGNDTLTNQATAYYQVISWLIKHKQAWIKP